MMEMPRDMQVKSFLQLTKETLFLANTRKLLFNHKAVYGNEVIALKVRLCMSKHDHMAGRGLNKPLLPCEGP